MTQRLKITRAKLISLAGILLIAAGVFAWFHSHSNAAQESEVQTVTVARANVQKTVLATGLIEADDLVSVGARTSGQIETLAVEIGDTVKSGDLIAQIDSLEQQNTVAQAKADLDEIDAEITSKEAEIKVAQLDVTRQTGLNSQKLSATSDLETAQATLDMAKAGLVSLQAQRARAVIEVSSAELDLDRTKITAPIDGTVVAIVNGEGTTVNASQDAPTIVKLAKLDKMQIKAEISEADVINVKAGQKVEFSLLGDPDKTYSATLDKVEPAPSSIEDDDDIDTDSAIYYDALFTVDNPDGLLRIGMSANVTIIIDEADDALTLPVSALPPKGPDGKYRVQVIGANDKHEMRAITVGLENSTTAAITDGLSEGDKVVQMTAPTGPPPSDNSQRRGGPGGGPPMMGM
ncbi:efflux RND transporter periplasmic adaptor subunit [Thioclava sp. GXIMD4216]|uniref:Efflux RND transporter periplasmic adaptor subunit n=1 Tax=Thioclava litoralis TaxID=3076557 RepID=A0ABZ1E0A8_9RHOB|nr:efflux RND transporter periplasmic adaptor subunit [Thioclava sp. FTW29]